MAETGALGGYMAYLGHSDQVCVTTKPGLIHYGSHFPRGCSWKPLAMQKGGVIPVAARKSLLGLPSGIRTVGWRPRPSLGILGRIKTRKASQEEEIQMVPHSILKKGKGR